MYLIPEVVQNCQCKVVTESQLICAASSAHKALPSCHTPCGLSQRPGLKQRLISDLAYGKDLKGQAIHSYLVMSFMCPS